MKTNQSSFFREANRPARWSTNLPSLWLFSCLAIAGLVLGYQSFTTPHSDAVAVSLTTAAERSVPRTKPIEQVQVGDRVWAENPLEDADLQFGDDVDAATWSKVILQSTKQDGSIAHINLLRPNTWIRDQGGEVGQTMEVSVPECGIEGQALVLAIEPCPPIAVGDGHVVTGTFTHEGATVIDLLVEGISTPIGTTPNHLFWSADRLEFVPAGKLKIGEALLAQAGTARLIAVTPRSGAERVYNLEVQCEHVFAVSDEGILVHNSKPCDAVAELAVSNNTARRHLDNALGGVRHDGLEAHHVIPWQFRDHDIVERAARGGFNINGVDNGILLPKVKHQADAFHPKYSEAIGSKLDRLQKELVGKSDAEVAAALKAYADQVKKGIDKSTGGLH